MDTKQDGLRDEMFNWLFSEICEAQVTGVPVAVDGRVYSVQEREELQKVMEQGYYMKSYVDDERGKIVQINFDHITNF